MHGGLNPPCGAVSFEYKNLQLSHVGAVRNLNLRPFRMYTPGFAAALVRAWEDGCNRPATLQQTQTVHVCS